jgi:ribosome-associated protein
MPGASRIAPSGDLQVPRGPGLSRGLTVPHRELDERFSHASGPGGQSVNTADSRVELRWAVDESAALTDGQRSRLLDRLGAVAVVVASDHRSQARNRVAARTRLAHRIAAAMVPDAVRHPTRPSHAARAARIDAKRRRSQLKVGRRRVEPSD